MFGVGRLLAIYRSSTPARDLSELGVGRFPFNETQAHRGDGIHGIDAKVERVVLNALATAAKAFAAEIPVWIPLQFQNAHPKTGLRQSPSA